MCWYLTLHDSPCYFQITQAIAQQRLVTGAYQYLEKVWHIASADGYSIYYSTHPPKHSLEIAMFLFLFVKIQIAMVDFEFLILKLLSIYKIFKLIWFEVDMIFSSAVLSFVDSERVQQFVE
jgi:hypothetical protein